MRSKHCPTLAQLSDFATGELPNAKQTNNITTHLATCRECQDTIEALSYRETIYNTSDTKQHLSPVLPNNAHSVENLEGEIFGEYEILQKISVGGMGIVYKAKHLRMDRLAAIKILPKESLGNANRVERFHREIRTTAQLRHQNIVHAYLASKYQSLPYLVMEFVDGEDLSTIVLRDGPLPIDTAIDYAIQAAHGLEYAHGKQLIHRDIKPSNLMVSDRNAADAKIEETTTPTDLQSRCSEPQAGLCNDRDKVVKLLDLGLVRSHESLDEIELTKSGDIMGTVDYMSPEQATNMHLADERSDVYALGCTLFFLLVGRPPFQGASVLEKMLAHADNPIPRLSELRKGVSKQIDETLQRMLAKQPEERQQTMRSVIRELEACRSDVVVPPIAPKSSPKITFARRHVLSVTVVLAMTFGTAWLMGFNPWAQDRIDNPISVNTPVTDVEQPSTVEQQNGSTASQPNSPPRPQPLIVPFSQQLASSQQQAWAENFGLEASRTNKLGMDFRLIPPGEFQRGNTDDVLKKFEHSIARYKQRLSAAQPRHHVRLTGLRYFGIHEVTQLQFQTLMSRNPSNFQDNEEHPENPNTPVNRIKWQDAIEFCNKLSEFENQSVCYKITDAGVTRIDGTGFRLPTEAEWEFAFLAGQESLFAYDGPEVDYAWYFSNSRKRPQIVGDLLPNRFGLHDMCGNMKEWCFDFYSASYYQQFANQTAIDPVGPKSGKGHVLRGASYGGELHANAIRFEGDFSVNCGFRVVWNVPQSASAIEAPLE